MPQNRFNTVEGIVEIYPKVFLIPHYTENLEKIGEKSHLYKAVHTSLAPDDFTHEQSLVFDTDKGLIIFNSCSHGGVANIINEAKSAIPNRKIYAYIGGFHMKGTKDGHDICTFSDDELDSLCEFLIHENVSHIYTGHCTGQPAMENLKSRLGSRIIPLTTGLKFEL